MGGKRILLPTERLSEQEVTDSNNLDVLGKGASNLCVGKQSERGGGGGGGVLFF